MARSIALALVMLAFSFSPAFGQITIDLGDHVLRPNEADQFIPILISTENNDQIRDANIFLQITGRDPRPQFNIISGFDSWDRQGSSDGIDPDITDGAIFEGPGFVFDGIIDFKDEIDSPTFSDAERNHLAFFAVSGTSETTADGILALLEVDTTGLFEGDFQITDISDASNFVNGSNDEVAKTSTAAGSITISAIPEPGSALALAGVCLAGLARRRRS